MKEKYIIGLDYGTLSARAVLVRVSDGTELADSVWPYAHGALEETLPDGTVLPPDFALELPEDYEEALIRTIRGVLNKAQVPADDVIAIGLDVTSATFLPVRDGKPLSTDPVFMGNPHAYLKLWKHHAAQEQAIRITELAGKRGERFLENCGRIVNSEWMLPKLLEIYEKAPEVWEHTDNFMEAGDWLVYLLTGNTTRCLCQAGYKLLWNETDGYPSEDFLNALAPGFGRMTEKLQGKEVRVGEEAGKLSPEMAEKLDLRAGISVAAACIDAHVAVPSVSIDGPGKALLILGTSCCMVLCSEKKAFVPGISGCVKDAVLPGLYGYEAGQSAVGDIFDWYVTQAVPAYIEKEAEAEGIGVHAYLSRLAGKLKPGESGLLALDWWNGNRSCLADANLSGLLLGLRLSTKPEEIYRALLESTAYGMRAILDEFEERGVTVSELYACGGIVKKNPLMMQIYADVLKREIRIAASPYASSLGAAIYAAVAAGTEAGGYPDLFAAARAMGRTEPYTYVPDPAASQTYDRLYAAYHRLHDHFGKGGDAVMKELLALKQDKNGEE